MYYDSYSTTNNSKSVSLGALFIAFSIAFIAGFGALCFATNAGHSDSSTGNPLKQQQHNPPISQPAHV